MNCSNRSQMLLNTFFLILGKFSAYTSFTFGFRRTYWKLNLFNFNENFPLIHSNHSIVHSLWSKSNGKSQSRSFQTWMNLIIGDKLNLKLFHRSLTSPRPRTGAIQAHHHHHYMQFTDSVAVATALSNKREAPRWKLSDYLINKLIINLGITQQRQKNMRIKSQKKKNNKKKWK